MIPSSPDAGFSYPSAHRLPINLRFSFLQVLRSRFLSSSQASGLVAEDRFQHGPPDRSGPRTIDSCSSGRNETN